MGKKKTYTERVTVLLTTEDLQRLADVSREKGASISGLIRMVVREWLEERVKKL